MVDGGRCGPAGERAVPGGRVHSAGRRRCEQQRRLDYERQSEIQREETRRQIEARTGEKFTYTPILLVGWMAAALVPPEWQPRLAYG